jgi:acyl-homoserine lactone acylase PvdQ
MLAYPEIGRGTRSGPAGSTEELVGQVGAIRAVAICGESFRGGSRGNRRCSGSVTTPGDARSVACRASSAVSSSFEKRDRRIMPEGRFTIHHEGRPISIRRDASGVPHISASRWDDSLFGLGFMHAQDRLTQLFFSRTVASGRAAEQIADKTELLETDRFFRRVGLHRYLDRDIELLGDPIRRQVDVFCAGVNQGIRQAGRSLPMWATGFRPEAWDARSVLLVGKLLSFGGLAVSQMQNERLLLEMIHAGANEEALKHLFAPRLDQADFGLLRQVRMSNQLSDEALSLLTDLPRLAGSNAWAVSPWRSESGSALLASDPHLEVNRLPAIWYEAVLEWDGHYVMGATLPGCPLFAVARTEKLAWGSIAVRTAGTTSRCARRWWAARVASLPRWWCWKTSRARWMSIRRRRELATTCRSRGRGMRRVAARPLRRGWSWSRPTA